MNRTILSIALLLAMLATPSCGRKHGGNQKTADSLSQPQITNMRSPTAAEGNGIYHWKTTFSLSEEDLAFLESHSVKRMYLRLFDVDMETIPKDRQTSCVPVATTIFKSPVPDNIEVVPAVFITTRSLMHTAKESGDLKELAERIYTRVCNMSDYNDLGEIHEIQLDCDWTNNTKEAFYSLCREIKALAEKDTIQISSTIRLHQLSKDPPPVDRGVLMVYNTGAVRGYDTNNSILEMRDVKLYLKSTPVRYALPLDFAYPVFGWGALFREGKYLGILHKTDFNDTRYYTAEENGYFKVIKEHVVEGHCLYEGDLVRLEYPSADEVKEVADYVSKSFPKASHNTILYHLDSDNLSKFTTDEIAYIYSR